MRYRRIPACLLLALTTTFATADDEKNNLSMGLSGARIAVLPFASAPERRDSGALARKLAIELLEGRYGATATRPGEVDTYLGARSIQTVDEHDLASLDAIAKGLGADIVVWGEVEQVTPKNADSETPPFARITVRAVRAGGTVVARASAQRQDKLPPTIFSSHPSFEKMARPLFTEIFDKLR